MQFERIVWLKVVFGAELLKGFVLSLDAVPFGLAVGAIPRVGVCLLHDIDLSGLDLVRPKFSPKGCGSQCLRHMIMYRQEKRKAAAGKAAPLPVTAPAPTPP